MGIRSTKEIYQVLEQRIREATAAGNSLTCVQLMDYTDVRQVAIEEYGSDMRVTTNKVSDALGLMWRRNFLTRYPAPPESNSLAKYAYVWSDPSPPKDSPLPPSILSTKKTGVNITEQDGGVLIEFDKFTVFVKPR